MGDVRCLLRFADGVKECSSCSFKECRRVLGRASRSRTRMAMNFQIHLPQLINIIKTKSNEIWKNKKGERTAKIKILVINAHLQEELKINLFVEVWVQILDERSSFFFGQILSNYFQSGHPGRHVSQRQLPTLSSHAHELNIWSKTFKWGANQTAIAMINQSMMNT